MCQLLKKLTACLLLLACAACSQEPKALSMRDTAIYYLNNRSYDDAILLLEQLRQQNPDDADAKLLLASAYSGRAGLNTFDAYEVIRPFINKQVKDTPTENSQELLPPPTFLLRGDAKLDDDPSQTNAPLATQRALAEKFERLILQHLDNFKTSFGLAFRLPHTPLDQRNDLIAALFLLDEIPTRDSMYTRAQTYAAVLNLIQYLNYMRDTFPVLTRLDGIAIQDFVCSIDIAQMLKNTDTLSYYLEAAVNALGQAINNEDGKKISHTLRTIQAQLVRIKAALKKHEGEISAIDFAQRFFAHAACNGAHPSPMVGLNGDH